jgi:indolepyruvate ferredoxin oxidoreductase beta subunit
MTKSILMTGVGGQGIILTAKILAEALVGCGYDVKMSEIHGMSQRGGTVNTQLKYGDRVYAPNIGLGEADIILAFEKAEALRALPYLKKGGRIVMDTREIYSMPVLLGQSEYPHDAHRVLNNVTGNVTLGPAGQIAEEMGNIKVQNICLLGALARLLELENIDWEALITRFVPAKLAELNISAFKRGYNQDYAL